LAKRVGSTEGANHDAHPAADAPLIMKENQPLVIPVKCSRRAGIQTGSVLAMPALDGKPFVRIRRLHPYPGEGRGGFIDRLGKVPG